MNMFQVILNKTNCIQNFHVCNCTISSAMKTLSNWKTHTVNDNWLFSRLTWKFMIYFGNSFVGNFSTFWNIHVQKYLKCVVYSVSDAKARPFHNNCNATCYSRIVWPMVTEYVLCWNRNLKKHRVQKENSSCIIPSFVSNIYMKERNNPIAWPQLDDMSCQDRQKTEF